MKSTIISIMVLILLCQNLTAEALSGKRAKSGLRSVVLRDLKGRSGNPLKADANRANVLLFITPDCPISNAYAPEFNAIVKEYAPKKIGFSIIYVATELPLKALRKHAHDFGYTCATYLDSKYTLVHRVHAKITPEVVVVLPNGNTAYQGRIDNLYVDFGKKRHAPTERYLREALTAILQGKKVPVPSTAPIGCYIPAP